MKMCCHALSILSSCPHNAGRRLPSGPISCNRTVSGRQQGSHSTWESSYRGTTGGLERGKSPHVHPNWDCRSLARKRLRRQLMPAFWIGSCFWCVTCHRQADNTYMYNGAFPQGELVTHPTCVSLRDIFSRRQAKRNQAEGTVDRGVLGVPDRNATRFSYVSSLDILESSFQSCVQLPARSYSRVLNGMDVKASPYGCKQIDIERRSPGRDVAPMPIDGMDTERRVPRFFAELYT